MRNKDFVDIDAIMIASFVKDWYPHIRFTVDLINENSIKMIETSIFSNNNIDLTKNYATSFMTGNVFSSSLLLNIGSKLSNKPEQIKFLTQMLIKSAPPVTLKYEELHNEAYGKVNHNSSNNAEDILDASNLVLLNVTEHYR